MLLTDPEVESSLLISSDEGATYQKYRLNFYILSLLFHPEQEDWILAYSHEQKVRERARSGGPLLQSGWGMEPDKKQQSGVAAPQRCGSFYAFNDVCVQSHSKLHTLIFAIEKG